MTDGTDTTPAPDFDVIVVGGGGAGLSAALMAAEQGASVIILEADTKLGGATALAGGVFYAAGTSVQRAAGIEGDNANAMFDYLMTINQYASHPSILRTISDHSAEALEWLVELGGDFPAEWMVVAGVDDVARGHCSRGGGGTVADALINAAGVAGIETAYGTRVRSLLVEEGRVVGVHTDEMDLRASSVVITTGGFGNNKDMLKRFYPTAASHGEWTFAVHDAAPFIEGDGLVMSEAIGANIVGHDTGLLNPTSGFGKLIEAFLPPWIILVNIHGRRFMDESAPYTVTGYLMNEQPERTTWAIFDHTALVEGGKDKSFADPYNSGVPLPTWDEEIILDQVQKGKVKTAPSLAELAARIDVDAPALEETVRVYNRDAHNGRDDQFFKQCNRHFPIENAPFYAVQVRAAIIGLTGAGLEIDADTQVLDTHGRPIHGLYAAGEVLGCLHAKRYAGGGMSIGPAVTLGRIAGKNAALHALSPQQVD